MIKSTNIKEEYQSRLLQKVNAQKKSKKICLSLTLMVVLLISVKLFSGSTDVRRQLSIVTEEFNLRNKRRKLSTDNNGGLRFVTFGTSVTHGAMMKDESQAYPFQLSPNTVNLAMRASDSSYPSMCTLLLLLHDPNRFPTM